MVTVKMENVLVSVIIFVTIIGLFSFAFTGMKNEYDINPQDLKDGQTILEKLENLQLIQGIEDIVLSIQKLADPTGTPFDIVGALTAAGIGILKVTTGTILLLPDVLGVITEFYYIPEPVSIGLGLIFSILIGFVVIKKATGGE